MPRSCNVEDLEDMRGVIENIIGRGNYFFVYKSETDKARGESHRFIEVDDIGPALRIFRHEVSDDENESPASLLEPTTDQPDYRPCLNENPDNQGVGGILNVVEFERIVPEESDDGDADEVATDDGKTDEEQADTAEEAPVITPTSTDDFKQLQEVVSEIIARGNYFHGQRRKHDKDGVQAQRRPPENRITRELTDIGELVNVFTHQLDGADGSKSELLKPYAKVKGRHRLCLNRKEGDSVAEGFLFVYEYERTGKDKKKVKRRLGMNRRVGETKQRSGLLAFLPCAS